MIGKVVGGRYEIVQLIGEGGMGAVFEARDRDSGQAVAVKLITDEEVARDEVLVARFEREALAAARVRSPHIVEILGAGHDPDSGNPFMVMELLTGENVLDVLRRLGPLPPPLAVRIGLQTCHGLAAAHAAGVVHRDIKPANLFLSRAEGSELVVKLLDFGVAKFKMDKASEADKQSLTRTGSMLGSPIYMSPEQARGLKSIDHRADIWSLGIVLHQLLTGRQPREGIDGLGELIITICSEPPPPVTEQAPWCSLELAAVISRALELAPSGRHPSAEAMGGALRRCLGGGDERIVTAMLVPLDERARRTATAEAPATLALEPADAAPISRSDIAPTVALEPERVRRQQAQRAALAAARLAPPKPRATPTTLAILVGVVVAAVALIAYLGWKATERGAEPSPIERAP